MSGYASSIAKLISQLNRLPGIGRKTAQRLAFYILNMDKGDVDEFAQSIVDAKNNVKFCQECCNLTDQDICDICSSDSRDKSTICVVENPSDVVAMEKTKEFSGLYHVLHGSISPMENIGPEDIHLRELLQRLQRHEEIQEIKLKVELSFSFDLED